MTSSSLLSPPGSIRSFSVRGLHGYKDVTIEFSSSAQILIAGNGAGKTTILNALYWLISRNFSKLRSLSFNELRCEFVSGKAVVLRHADLPRIDDINQSGPFSQAEVSSSELESFLSESWHENADSRDFRSNSVVTKLYNDTAMDYDDITNLLSRTHESLGPSSEPLKEVNRVVIQEMSNLEIVHLPTYRRIEESLLGPKRGPRQAALFGSKLRRPQTTRTRNAINYGLEDVINRLDELSEEIDSISSLEYRNASATIIDDALSNSTFAESSWIDTLPEFPLLEQFLLRVSRLEGQNSWDRLTSRPAHATAKESGARRIEAIRRLYETREIFKQQPPVLGYFLSKLVPVIERTQETAGKLQRFVDACNSYLSDSTDGKSFVYEPNSSKVSVINTDTGRQVPMGQLSSGEKQIISLLAELYLYDGEKIILIDEPELSLSIEWQRKIIPDIMRSGVVRQLLAITHSPFIFDNEIDPHAGPLIIRKRVANGNS